MHLVASVCGSVRYHSQALNRQGHGSRSNFWRAAVDVRGSALPSAAKSNNHHYESEVTVCVSVISGRMLYFH